MLVWEAEYMERDIETSKAIAGNPKSLETFLRTDQTTRSFLGLIQSA